MLGGDRRQTPGPFTGVVIGYDGMSGFDAGSLTWYIARSDWNFYRVHGYSPYVTPPNP